MTKLLEWLSLAAAVGLVWAGAYTDTLLPQYKTQLLWSPVILVLLFGLFSVVTIIYRWQNGLSFYSIERHPTNVFACRVATRPRHHVRQVPADGAPGRAAEVHAAGAGRHHGYLLDLLDTELCQPAQQLYPHNLAGILETAIRGTNTQFEDHEILERLDVRLLLDSGNHFSGLTLAPIRQCSGGDRPTHSPVLNTALKPV